MNDKQKHIEQILNNLDIIDGRLCYEGEPIKKPKPIELPIVTYADYIRSLNNEEFAEWIKENTGLCDNCAWEHKAICREQGKTCYDGILEKLNQPYKKSKTI